MGQINLLGDTLTLRASRSFFEKYASKEFDQEFLDIAGLKAVHEIRKWEPPAEGQDEGRIVLTVSWDRNPGT